MSQPLIFSQRSHMVSLDLGELSVSQSHTYPAEKGGSSEPPRTPLRTALCIHTCKPAIGMEVAKSEEAGIYKEHCADEDSLGQGSHMQGKGTVSCDNQGEY